MKLLSARLEFVVSGPATHAGTGRIGVTRTRGKREIEAAVDLIREPKQRERIISGCLQIKVE
jgi:hypothetical protein